MKYLITESQFDKVIFRYLDNQDFIVIKMENRLYYVNSEGDEYAQVRYHPKDRYCTINYNLVEEISKFFSLGTNECIDIINKWVENKVGVKSMDVIMASPIVGY